MVYELTGRMQFGRLAQAGVTPFDMQVLEQTVLVFVFVCVCLFLRCRLRGAAGCAFCVSGGCGESGCRIDCASSVCTSSTRACRKLF